MVHGSQVTVDHVGWAYKPQGLTSAQLNLPFCVATLLLEGDVFVDQFREQDVENADRIALSRKVEVVHDPKITAQGSKFRHKVRVDVHYTDGHVESEMREAPRGSEHSFASADDIVAKFGKLAAKVMAEKQHNRLAEAILGMEKLERASQLIELLRVT